MSHRRLRQLFCFIVFLSMIIWLFSNIRVINFRFWLFIIYKWRPLPFFFFFLCYIFQFLRKVLIKMLLLRFFNLFCCLIEIVIFRWNDIETTGELLNWHWDHKAIEYHGQLAILEVPWVHTLILYRVVEGHGTNEAVNLPADQEDLENHVHESCHHEHLSLGEDHFVVVELSFVLV